MIIIAFCFSSALIAQIILVTMMSRYFWRV